MTVSFTKDEVSMLLNFIYVATQDLDDEEECAKEILDKAKKIKEKIKIAKTKEIMKKVTRQLNNNPYLNGEQDK